MKCRECGQVYVETTGDYHFKSSGLDNAYIEDARLIKCGCGVHGLRKSRHMGSVLDELGNAVINKPGPLNGQEIRYLRKNAGMPERPGIRQIVGGGPHHALQMGKRKSARAAERFF